jgi:hypothetical protein
MAEGSQQWCVLNLRKFPYDLRRRLHIRSAKEDIEIYEVVARYVKIGLDREDAEEQAQLRQKKK